MKLKWIAALAAIALWCVPAKAQDFVQSYNFVNTGTNGPTTSFANTGVTSFFITWSPQVSLSACSIQVDSSSDGASWGSGDLIASTSCTTAGSSATATLGAGKNFVRIHVTALTGNGGLNVTMKGWGGGGSGGGIPGSSPGGNVTTNPLNSGAQFNGHRVKDASTTNTGFHVTCPNGDCHFLTTAYVGEPMWCTVGSTVNSILAIGSTVAGTPETIQTINSDTDVTLTPNAASSTNVATAICAWVTDDGGGTGTLGNTSLNTSWNNASAIAANTLADVYYQLPSGLTMTSTCLWSQTTYPNNGSYNSYIAPTIEGAGEGSTIILVPPWFSLSSPCPAGGSGGSWPPLFGPATAASPAQSYSARYFTIDGLGYTFPGVAFGSRSILGTGVSSSPGGLVLMNNIDLVGLGTGTSSNGLVGLVNSGPNSSYANIFVDGAGFNAFFAIPPGNGSQQIPQIDFFDMFFGDTKGTAAIIANAQPITVNDFGSVYGPGGSGQVDLQITGSGTVYNGTGISCIDQVTTACVQCISNAVCNIQQSQLDKHLVTGGDGLLIQSGAIARVRDSVLKGNATGAGVSTASGTVFFDEGGNTEPIPNAVAGTLIADGHSVKGTCTGSATASSTLGLYGTGPNATTTTCTSTTIGSGFPVSGARTLQNLVCTVGVAGTTSSTCTVLVNGGASTITCTIAGAGTNCSDGTHSVALNDGDLVSIEFISGAATTPQGVKAIVEWN